MSKRKRKSEPVKYRGDTPRLAAGARSAAATVREPFPWGRGILLFAAVMGVPFFLRVWIEHRTRSVLETNVPIVDVMIWLALAALCVSALRTRRHGASPDLSPNGKPIHNRLPCSVRDSFSLRPLPFSLFPVPFFLCGFIGVCALSLFASGGSMGGIVDLVQAFNYYIVWFCIVVWAVHRDALRDCLIAAAGVVLLLGAAAAALQIRAAAPPYLVRGLFRDHPAYVAAFVILAPLVWTRMIRSAENSARPPAKPGADGFQVDRDPPSGRVGRWLGHAVIGAGCALLASLSATVLVLAELWIASRLMGGRWQRRALATTAVTVVVLMLLPSDHRVALLRAPGDWFTVPMTQRRNEVLQAVQSIHPPKPAVHFGVGPWRCFAATNIGHTPHIDPIETPPSSGKDLRGPGEYYAECWAALELLAAGPMLGSGMGQWQETIGTGFGVLERTGTLFPNSSNGYLMLAVTTGLPGMTAWTLALFGAQRRGVRRLRGRRPPIEDSTGRVERAIVAGCLAGLAGSAVCLLFTPFVFQPVAAYWVLLAAILCARRTPAGAGR